MDVKKLSEIIMNGDFDLPYEFDLLFDVKTKDGLLYRYPFFSCSDMLSAHEMVKEHKLSIELPEPPCMVKIKEDSTGLNLRMYLDGMLSTQSVNVMDIQTVRNKFIAMIEEEIKKCDWISLSDGTMYTKSFIPGGRDVN